MTTTAEAQLAVFTYGTVQLSYSTLSSGSSKPSLDYSSLTEAARVLYFSSGDFFSLAHCCARMISPACNTSKVTHSGVTWVQLPRWLQVRGALTLHMLIFLVVNVKAHIK